MIEKWFETPIYTQTASERDFHNIQNDINRCLQEFDSNCFSKKQEWGSSNQSISDITFSRDIISEYNLDYLKNFIKLHVNKFLLNLSNHTYCPQIKASWFTKTKKNEHAIVHHHAKYDLACVYYYKTNGNDGSIFFTNPLLSLVSNHFLSSHEVISYTPEEGKLIIFPAWLPHGVRTNETENERISLSCNIRVNSF